MTVAVPMPPVGGVPYFPPGGAGGEPRNLDLDPLIPVMRRALTQLELLRPLKTVVDVLDSGPLLNVCLVSLKSVPYVYHAENRLVGHFDNALSCRMRYLEAAAMATASLVHNIVFGLIFSIASLVTLGQVPVVMDQMLRHWTHTALAAASVAVGVVGTASPALGMKANVAALLVTGFAIMLQAQGGAVERVKTAYQCNAQNFKDAVLNGLGGDRAYFNQHFVPFFNHLDQNLGPNVQSLEDLGRVVREAIPLFPAVAPAATPQLVRDNLMGMASEWSGDAVTV